MQLEWRRDDARERPTARPVAMMESGPVGGIIASARDRRNARLSATSSRSTWAAPRPRPAWCATASRRWRAGYYVGGYASGHPVMLPVIDVVEVGAGGGSIAWIDDVGALKVGPHSAGADPGPDLLSAAAAPSRPSPTPTWCSAGSAPTIFSAARWSSIADGARDGIAEQDRQAAGDGAPIAARAGHRRDRRCQNVARGARGVGREGLRPARFRAGGLGRRRPAARLRDRARAAHPDRHRAAVPVAFLGARHADRRRAPRFHPHLLLRPRQPRFPGVACRARRNGRARPSTACDMRATPNGRSRSTCAMSARSSRSRCRCRATPSRKATGRKFARRSMRFTSIAIRTTSPDEPVEIVNIRLAAIGKRQQLRFPRLTRRAAAKATRRRDVYLGDTKKPVSCPIYQRGDLGRGRAHQRAGVDRGARHHHGAVRQRSLHGGAVRRTDDRCWRRKMTKKAKKRPRAKKQKNRSTR